VSRYQKGKTNLDFTKARDSEWQWHQLGRMQVCTSLQTENHASTPPLSFLQAGCPSCHPTNSIKALKALGKPVPERQNQSGFMRQEMTGFWDGSGISWTIWKQSAPRSRQITTPTPHHSIFTGQMLFQTPHKQCQSKGNTSMM